MFKEKRDAPKNYNKNKNFKPFKKNNNDWNKGKYDKKDKKEDEEGFKRSDKVAKKDENPTSSEDVK